MVPSPVGTRRLVVLCGPTATGKTAVALAVARLGDGEIIAADSRTVYRGLDIGTAKPSAADRATVPHHLLDVADPTEVFTVADFQGLATAAVGEIFARGRRPLLAGGTGLYIRAVVDGLVIPHVSPNWAFRAAAEAEERERPGVLHARLLAQDPAAAARMHPRNLRRIIRALEVIAATGTPISTLQRTRPHPWPVVMVGLRMPRALLGERIDERVDAQVAAGLVDEVRNLLAAGIPPAAPAMQALGYKELVAHLVDGLPLPDAVALLKRNTRRYARRQETWFSRDTRIRWIEIEDAPPAQVTEAVRAMLAVDDAGIAT